mgnify:CR=1 FL=1
MREIKDILPELATHPLVVKAADEIAKLLPELEGVEKSESVSKKLKEKTKDAKPKKAKAAKRKEEVAI